MTEETKRRRRPATGRILNKQVSAQVTEPERDQIKNYIKQNELTVRELLLLAIQKNIAKNNYLIKRVSL